MAQAVEYFTIAWLGPQLLVTVAIGTFSGIYIGVIPGLSVTIAVSIPISSSFAWDIRGALCLVVGIFMGGAYGGSRTAILGVILSRLIDETWRRAVISDQESLSLFFVKTVSSPLSLVPFLVVVLIIIGQAPLWTRPRRALGGRTA